MLNRLNEEKMRKRICLWGFWMALMASLVVAPTLGENGRDFAGHYNVKDVVDLGENVQVTFSVRLFNYSGADGFASHSTHLAG